MNTCALEGTCSIIREPGIRGNRRAFYSLCWHVGMHGVRLAAKSWVIDNIAGICFQRVRASNTATMLCGASAEPSYVMVWPGHPQCHQRGYREIFLLMPLTLAEVTSVNEGLRPQNSKVWISCHTASASCFGIAEAITFFTTPLPLHADAFNSYSD